MAVQEVVVGAAAARAKLNEALDAVQTLSERAESLAGADPVPETFVGIIRNYRFGNDPNDPAPKGMPSHRFELECNGGMWVHVSVGSDRFDAFIASLPSGDMETFSPDALQGRLAMVTRDPGYGRCVPTTLFESAWTADGIRYLSAEGKFLYPGARVRVGSGTRTVREPRPPSDGRPIVTTVSDDGTENDFYADNTTLIPE